MLFCPEPTDGHVTGAVRPVFVPSVFCFRVCCLAGYLKKMGRKWNNGSNNNENVNTEYILQRITIHTRTHTPSWSLYIYVRTHTHTHTLHVSFCTCMSLDKQSCTVCTPAYKLVHRLFCLFGCFFLKWNLFYSFVLFDSICFTLNLCAVYLAFYLWSHR